MSCTLFAQKDTYDQLKTQYDSLRKAENFEGALVAAKQMNTWALKNETDTSLRYAVSLRQVGNIFMKLQIGDSALFYWNKSISILEKQKRSETLDAARCICNIALLFEQKKDYKNAILNFKKELDIRLKLLGEADEEYSKNLANLGALNYEIGDFKASEKYYIMSLEIIKKNFVEKNLDYVNIINNLGLLYYDMGDYRIAEPYLKEALEIRRIALGEEHPEYAGSLNNLGNLYSDMGDYKTAEPLYKQALEIKKKTLGEEHPDYAMSLNNLGLLYSDMGNYKAAKSYYEQSLEIYKKVLGEKHPDYARCLHNIGLLYENMGDFNAAEPYYNNSLKIYKIFLGHEHPIIIKITLNIGNLYRVMGDFKTADFFLKESLEICEKVQGKENPVYASSLNNLGLLYSDMGDYKAAELYYKQALEIRKKALGHEHPDYAKSLNNLGILYQEMGDYKSAEPFYKQSLEIYKIALGEEHPSYAMSLNNLGLLYSDMGDYKAAEPYYKQALEIKKKALGEEHPDYAASLNNLGILYSAMCDYNAAEPYFKQALDIKKKTLGEEHPYYAMSLNNFGSLFKIKCDYKAAEPYYKQALAINKQTLGDAHPDYAKSLNNLGILYKNMGDYNAAEPYLNRAIKVKINNLSLNFSWLSAQEKKAYWQQEKDFYNNMNSFSVSAVDSVPSSTELSYNANLISKSLLLETTLELDQAIAQSSDEEMKTQFLEMKQLRKLYSKMQSEGSSNKEIMERYKIQADSLDKILVNKLGEYAASKRKFEITWKDVQSNLATTDAAIEFARYYDDKDSLYKYMALVVRPDYEYPKLVNLGKEEAIRTAAQNKDFSKLYNEAWKGIDSLLVGVNRVYYSPAGELNNVSFSALCTEEGNELVASNKEKNRGVVIGNDKTTTKACNAVLMDKYELHQLTTTRYLADGTLKKEKPMQPSLALVGGINFDDVPEQTKEADKEQSNEDFAFHANLNKRTASANSKKRGKRSSSNYGKKMDPLPGTKEEVVNIAGLLNTSNWKVQTRSDKKAGEYEFKKELETKAPGVLHIATHGFAFPDEAKKESKLLDMNQTSTYKVSEDPMVRCGLMLGGSNISWTGNPQKMIEQTGDDGILTAAEVANLDLSNTKLVVLSACETGLGKIEGSEGTFGLKRGFKLAGVEQIIVSLWSVPDKETMELMTLFYGDLTKTLNPVTSFEKAQKEMRNKYPTDPEKWAGFVLVR